MSVDMALEFAGIGAEAVLCALIIYKRVYRLFPVFCIYMIWGVLNDSLMMVVSLQFPNLFFRAYLVEMPLDSMLQFGILVELAWSVFRPIRSLLPKGTLFILAGLILLAGAAMWPIAGNLALPGFGAQSRLLVQFQQTFSILRILFFLALAGCSQLLAIGWRNRELQIATGLGLYSLMSMGAAVLYTHHASQVFFHSVNQAVTVSWICSVFYWLVSFAQEEAPRGEFNPKVQSFLLAVAGAARANRIALEDVRKNNGR